MKFIIHSAMPRRTRKKTNNTFLPNTYSREATQVTFDRLKVYLDRDRWLGSGNRYASNCVDRICKDYRLDPKTKAITNDIVDKQLAEYIAASAPLHAIDGWGFLGKAIVSHSIGDIEACKHFAYYAQLRAVMSLMASEGIGIFDKKHFAIKNADGRTSSLGSPRSGHTHEFAGLQFKSWAKSKNSGKLLEQIIRPRGLPLEEWFKEISPTKINWLAQDWLEHWGYDLNKFKKDQGARNRASYRPTVLDRDLRYRTASVTQDSLDLAEAIWRMCIPDGVGSFNLDLHLMRASWDEYSQTIGSTPTRAEREVILSNLGILQPELGNLIDFFERATFPVDSIVLTEARKKGSPEEVNYHSQMLCRATLLLRIATGASASLISQAGFKKRDLKFWSDFVGENYGLWETGDVDPIVDIWTEVEEALRDLNIKAPTIDNHYKWRSELAREVLILSGCERIGLAQFCL